MINETNAKLYCHEDISLIENYSQAVQDSNMWDCHHRAETDECLTQKELKAQGRYWKRPASELIFLTKSQHKKLHYDAGTFENIREAVRKIGGKYARKGGEASALKLSKAVMQFTKDGTLVREWSSTIEVQRQLGFYNSYICQCCNGKYKQAYGYLWRYK